MIMTILTVLQVLIALAMIGIILVQRGTGAAAGAGFGAGASGTVFGSSGAGSFLTRSTAILAIGFFSVSLLMAVLVSDTIQQSDDVDLGVMGIEQPSAAPRSGGDVPMMSTETPGDLPIAPMEALPGDAGDVPAAPSGEADEGQPTSGENDNG